jgi:membrane protein
VSDSKLSTPTARRRRQRTLREDALNLPNLLTMGRIVVIPLVLVLLAIVGVLFRDDPGGAWNKLTQHMSYYLDQSAVSVVQNIAQQASQPGKGLTATIVGVALALFGASGVFGQLQDALNTIWGVKAKPGAGVWGFLRVLSFAMVGGICFQCLCHSPWKACEGF